MRSSTELSAVLGGRRVLRRKVESASDLAELVRAGLPFAAFAAVQRGYGLTQEGLAATIRLPRSTLVRRRRDGRLSPGESDRLCRLARILAHATRVLGDREAVHEWLLSPIPALGSREPIHLLDTDVGTEQVDQALGQIEHGIVG